jgi:hypothetical protein
MCYNMVSYMIYVLLYHYQKKDKDSFGRKGVALSSKGSGQRRIRVKSNEGKFLSL